MEHHHSTEGAHIMINSVGPDLSIPGLSAAGQSMTPLYDSQQAIPPNNPYEQHPMTHYSHPVPPQPTYHHAWQQWGPQQQAGTPCHCHPQHGYRPFGYTD